MPATLTQPLVECAPGNLVKLAGTDLAPGTGASVVLGEQLVVDPTGATPPAYTGTLAIPATFETTDVTFTVPDGATSGTLTVTSHDGSTATCGLRVVSQYVQASEYIGEGIDTSDLAAGELDQILREASSYVDAFVGVSGDEPNGLRLLQTVEHPKFRGKQKGPPRFWPWRRPIVSLDSLVFVSSNQIRTAFKIDTSSSDIFVNADLGYVEILAYALGNYALLGAIQTIGFSANVIELVYTAGYPMLKYPGSLRKACKIVTTELLTYRKIQAGGFGGFSSVQKGASTYTRRSESFSIPSPAAVLLRPFKTRRFA